MPLITLPDKIRQAFGLNADDQLMAETTPEDILLRQAVTLPLELYSPERVQEFDAAEEELAHVMQRVAICWPLVSGRLSPPRRTAG